MFGVFPKEGIGPTLKTDGVPCLQVNGEFPPLRVRVHATRYVVLPEASYSWIERQCHYRHNYDSHCLRL